MRKRTAHRSAYGFAIFVFALIVLVILGALSIKLFLVFAHSSFDGKHQFSIEIQEPGKTRFIVFNPDAASIHTLLVSGTISGSASLSLGVPIDAVVQSTRDIAPGSDLANALLFPSASLHTTLTPVDAINLFIFMHMADSGQALSRESGFPLASSSDHMLSQVFLDTTLYKEGESISIINGTGISGLGTKIAQVCLHMGANVVSVTTADVPTPVSSIGFIGNESYTAQRLSHLLHLPLTHLSRAAISDITVTIGTDIKNIQYYQ